MSQHDQNQMKPTSDSRRRLVQGGLAGAPLLMMLKSAPALAVNCKQPSGFSVSGNMSKTGEINCAQPENGPQFWIVNTSASISKDELVGVALGASTYNGGGFNGFTLQAALEGADDFLKLIVAAYLNAGEGTFPVDQLEVKKMWMDAPGAGYIAETTHNTAWDAFKVAQYLRYTMGLVV